MTENECKRNCTKDTICYPKLLQVQHLYYICTKELLTHKITTL